MILSWIEDKFNIFILILILMEKCRQLNLNGIEPVWTCIHVLEGPQIKDPFILN